MLYDSHLDLFVQVARLGSFSKAAQASLITPSAVIKQMNLLEENLGIRLFIRTHRGLQLTEAGKLLLEEAPAFMRTANDLQNRLIQANCQEDNVIRIGTSPLTPAEVLIEFWPQVSGQLPGLKFQLVPFENNPQEARRILKTLGQDIDVVAGVFDEALLAYRECAGMEISSEPLCVACSVNHPLAGKKQLKIEDLYGQQLMMQRPGSMKSMDELRAWLTQNHPQIEIVNFDLYTLDVFNQCENGHRLLITVERWKNVHPLIRTVKMDWAYTMPYGLLHSPRPEPKVQRFLDVLKTVI